MTLLFMTMDLPSRLMLTVALMLECGELVKMLIWKVLDDVVCRVVVVTGVSWNVLLRIILGMYRRLAVVVTMVRVVFCFLMGSVLISWHGFFGLRVFFIRSVGSRLVEAEVVIVVVRLAMIWYVFG